MPTNEAFATWLREIEERGYLETNEMYCEPTRVEESKETIHFDISPIFPHPVEQLSSFTVESADGGVVIVELFDVLGRKAGVVFSGKVYGRTRIWVNASDLTSGVYLMRVRTGHGIETTSVVVRK